MPCLDMKDGRVVKEIHFAASVENRKKPAGEWVHNAASAIWIPLRVGGGIGSQEDIRLVLEAGARKVSMNSAAVKNPDLVSEAARTLGSKTITVAIDDAISVPVVASGGAGTLEHFYEAFVQGGTLILPAASVSHHRSLSIHQVKTYLWERVLPVNL